MSEHRVLFVIASHRWTGAAQPLAFLARAMKDAGVRVLFGCGEGVLQQAVNERGLDCEVIYPARTSWAARLTAPERLRRVLRRFEPTAVHAVLSSAYWISGLVAKRNGRRIVVAHNFRQAPLRHDVLHRWLFTRRYDGIIDLAQEIVQADCRNLRLTHDRVLHLPGAVDAAQFDRPGAAARLRATVGVPSGVVLIGVVARMQARRRHEAVIRAVAAARERLPDFRLVLVGKGEHRPALERLVCALGLQADTIWANDHAPDFADCVAGLDLAVYPAEGSDGSARTVLEHMAGGVPVIAAPRPVLRELITDGVNGRLVDPDNTQALAQAVVDLVRDHALRQRLAMAAKAQVTETMTWPQRAERVLWFYERLQAMRG